MLKRIFSLTATTFLLLSCGIFNHSGKSTTPLPGVWQSTPIIIDGDSKDWPSPYPNYDSKAMIAYATSNDARNLYVTMESGDEKTLFKILKQGMTLSIDTNGKKDPQFHINYPLQNDNEPLDILHAHESKSQLAAKQSELKINRLMTDANQLSTEGFADCGGGYMVSQTLPCGIKIRARIDEYKELVWEAVVPFKAIYSRDSLSAADAGRPISVCFNVKAFRPAVAKNSAGDNNTSMTNEAGMAGNNSRMHNGGGRGTSRPSTQDPNQHYYENTKTWKQFGIVYRR